MRGAEEVGGGTWEGQRMSGLSAWSMSWGKLFGGAVFPWYCGLICLGVMVWYGLKVPQSELRLPVWHQVATLLIGAILAQATSLTVALVLLRKVQFRRRLTVTMAQIAGIQAAKRTADLIPLCHSLALCHVAVSFRVKRNQIEIECVAETAAQTGVEMEALTGASVAALTLYDMCKAVDKAMRIEGMHVVAKVKK